MAAQQPPLLGELAKRVGEILPELLPPKAVAGDLEKSVKAVAQSVLTRLDLVTREEFDAQVVVLQRTRERVQSLESQLETLTRALDQLEAERRDS